jgi:DNA (cytosine-5)-methyltransferase 1
MRPFSRRRVRCALTASRRLPHTGDMDRGSQLAAGGTMRSGRPIRQLASPRVTRRGPSDQPKSRRSGRPIAIDLFAGAGGLSLGFEQAGFDVVSAVEYDPVHSAVHAFNFPHTDVLCADLARLSGDDLLASARRGLERHGASPADWTGQVDAIVGGPPCQGFSTIGKRLVDDTRNRLVFHFFRLISEIRPRYFVMENVPGMAAGGHANILERLIEEFARIGYRVPDRPQVLNAADYGVPQDRRRLFLIGGLLEEAPANYPEPTVCAVPKRPGAARRRPPGAENLPAGPTVWDAIGDLPDLDRYDRLWDSDAVRLPAADHRRAERRASPYAAVLRGSVRDPEDRSYRRRFDPSLLTSSARTRHTDLSIARFAATAPGETEPVSRFYRLDPDGLCNTLRAGTGSERGAYTSPRPIHPTLPRVLSVREAARLHSFPDWFRLHATKWHGFRQIGNAVAPLVGRAVGQEILRALDVRRARPRRFLPLGDDALLSLQMVGATAYFGADKEAIPAQRVRPRKEPVAA